MERAHRKYSKVPRLFSACMHSCVQVAGRAAWPAGYPDLAVTVLADDGENIIRIYGL